MTSAMKSVEAAFTKGGGSGTFVPGHASAKEEAPTSENSSNSATQGIGKQEHGEKFGEQLPKEGVIGQMFHKAVSGDEQGMQGRTTTAG